MIVRDHMPRVRDTDRTKGTPRHIDTYRASRRATAKAHYRFAKRQPKRI